MKNTAVVDTNVIIRYLVGDHPEHFHRAVSFWNEVKSGQQRAFLPESVLAETVYVLLKIYRVPRLKIAENLLGLLSYKGLVGEIGLFRRALEIFAARKIDIVDALVLSWAEVKGYQIASFDRDVSKGYFHETS